MKRMTVLEFGEALIRTGDLDPIYLMLQRASLSLELRARWSMAYWMFYHAGVSSRIAESKDFWGTVQQAIDEKWPRGTERRHFRGQQCQDAVNELRAKYRSGEDAVAWLRQPHPEGMAFRVVSNRVQSWRGFGPWISFKIADMLDAVLDCPVDFEDAVLFDDPVKGAALVHYVDVTGVELDMAKEIVNQDNRRSWEQFLPTSLAYLRKHIGSLTAPHNTSRSLQLQELETVLCKYKSHLNGKYNVGKDSLEIHEALAYWGDLAESLRHHVPGDH